MKELSIGQVISKRRQELGISQEDLCGDICQQATLSRLENGKGTPSARVINALLQKLGLEEGRFYARLSANEERIEGLHRELVSCCVRFEHALDENSGAIRTEAYQKLHDLEKIVESGDHLTAQFLLHCRVILGREDGSSYQPQEALELLTKAIRLTAPCFNLEHIADGLYCLNETKLINHIAVIYWNAGDLDKAAEIYRQLLAYVQAHNKNVQESRGMLCLVAHNYAGCLLKRKQYDEATEIAELGRKACVEYGHYQHLGGLLHTLGICYHHFSDDKKSIECFFEAYFQYKAAGNENGVVRLQADANEYFSVLKHLNAGINALFG